MKCLRWVRFLPLLGVSACDPATRQDKPHVQSTQVAEMADSLYKEVVARRPLSTPDRKVFGPYISRGLLHSFDLDDACFDRWRRANPDPNLKPVVGLIEFPVFSRGAQGDDPQVFHIENVQPQKDGSYRVRINLTHSEASYKQSWEVVVVAILENGRPVVDDLIYLKQGDMDEARLSEILKEDCKGLQ
jgi:hypothetical protein